MKKLLVGEIRQYKKYCVIFITYPIAKNGKRGTKGQINFLTDTKAVISLFETADKSTLLHESMHFFERLTSVLAADGNALAKKEMEAMNNMADKYVRRKDAKGKDKYKTDKDYNVARKEYLARSFEGYLRNGAAPSKELRGVFERFKGWLSDVYTNIKDLNVTMSKDVVNFFDGYIVSNNANSQNFTKEMENQAEFDKLQDEIDKTVSELYQNNPDLSEGEVNKIIEEKYGDRIRELNDSMSEDDYDRAFEKKNDVKEKDLDNKKVKYGKIIMTVYNVIRELGGEKMEARIRRLEMEKMQMFSKYKVRFEPYLKKYEGMTPEDRATLDLSLFNGNMKKANEILDKYNMQKEYEEKRRIQKELKDFALTNGIEIGEIEYEYNPRRVRNYAGLMDYLEGDGKNVNSIRNEIKKLDKNNDLTPEEKEYKISGILNGYFNRLSTGSVANAKERTINMVKPEYLKFYYNSADSTSLYIRDIINRGKNNELFGKGENTDEQLSNFINLDDQLTLTRRP
jgi:hypothetical protein